PSASSPRPTSSCARRPRSPSSRRPDPQRPADLRHQAGPLASRSVAGGSARMHPTVLLPAAACLTSAACAGFIAAREAPRNTALLIAIIYLGTAWWALCEVAVSLATSHDEALLWMRASVPGWILLGPLVLHLFSTVAGEAGRRTRALLFGLY